MGGGWWVVGGCGGGGRNTVVEDVEVDERGVRGNCVGEFKVGLQW